MYRQTRVNPRMKRILFFITIAALCNPANADWVKVGEADDLTYYFDAAAIRRDGNLRRVWILQDFKERRSLGELSLRALSEYDCKKWAHRALDMSIHSGNMASGKVLSTMDVSDTSKWQPIPPKTVSERILITACSQ